MTQIVEYINNVAMHNVDWKGVHGVIVCHSHYGWLHFMGECGKCAKLHVIYAADAGLTGIEHVTWFKFSRTIPDVTKERKDSFRRLVDDLRFAIPASEFSHLSFYLVDFEPPEDNLIPIELAHKKLDLHYLSRAMLHRIVTERDSAKESRNVQ